MCSRSTRRRIKRFDAFDARAGHLRRCTGFIAQQRDGQVLPAAEVRPPAELDLVRRRDGVFREFYVAGEYQQVVFRTRAGPIAADGDLADELPLHKPADFDVVDIQRRVELQHGAARRLDDDRRRAVGPAAAIDDYYAGTQRHAAVAAVFVVLKEQLGLIAFEDFRRRQPEGFKAARRKILLHLLQPRVGQFARSLAVGLGNFLHPLPIDRRLDERHDRQRICPVDDHNDRKTAGDATYSRHWNRGL